MCGGGGGDGGAAELRRQEAERQARINAATAKVNEIFGAYTPDTYSKVSQDYSAYALPQVDDQYREARKKVTYSLADRGLLDSSEAANQFGELDKFYETQKGNVANQGADFANQYRSSIEDARTGLLSLAQGAPEIGAIASQASARANALSAPPAFSPVGDLFAKFLNQAVASQAIAGSPTAAWRRPDAGTAVGNAGNLSYQVK